MDRNKEPKSKMTLEGNNLKRVEFEIQKKRQFYNTVNNIVNTQLTILGWKK